MASGLPPMKTHYLRRVEAVMVIGRTHTTDTTIIGTIHILTPSLRIIIRSPLHLVTHSAYSIQSSALILIIIIILLINDVTTLVLGLRTHLN